MDHTSRGRSLCSFAQSPALDFVLTRGKVVNELQSAITTVNQLVHHSGGTELSCSRVSCVLVWGASESEHLLLEVSRVGQHRAAAISVDPCLDLGKPLVLLLDVLIASNVH